MQPRLSHHFETRTPSAVRLAQIAFSERIDGVEAVNTAIGNVSLPIHPALFDRMQNLTNGNSIFKDGVVKYAPTPGMQEAKDAFKNIMHASGIDVSSTFVQITDGGSQAMELAVLGVTDPERPIMVIEPAYPNYYSFVERTGRQIVTMRRTLNNSGAFTFPSFDETETFIAKHNPAALVIIPYDNPTGQLVTQEDFIQLARLCVKHNMWIISDEAYRELHYGEEDEVVSIWNFSEEDVSGITGRRISIESASKVWNACGLRIGALVTDSEEFYTKSVAEYTANLCSNALGQYVFGALAHESKDDLQSWYTTQRDYYRDIISQLHNAIHEKLPEAILSLPQAALYLVVDVRNMVDENFNIQDFVLYCAKEGKVEIDGTWLTLLVAPLSGFYNESDLTKNPGRTQMRIAAVETPERLALVVRLLKELLFEYLGKKF